jgi:hypothetical protein
MINRFSGAGTRKVCDPNCAIWAREQGVGDRNLLSRLAQPSDVPLNEFRQTGNAWDGGGCKGSVETYGWIEWFPHRCHSRSPQTMGPRSREPLGSIATTPWCKAAQPPAIRQGCGSRSFNHSGLQGTSTISTSCNCRERTSWHATLRVRFKREQSRKYQNWQLHLYS